MTNPTTTDTVETTNAVIHFTEYGLTYRVSESPYVPGLTSSPADVLELTPLVQELNAQWLALADDEDGQRRAWGKVMFRSGFPSAELLERVAAERDREASDRHFAAARDARSYGVTLASY